MKLVLHLCIGRHILDNVTVAHEALHFFKNNRNGKTGFIFLKLDMTKGYDKVEWHYLEAIMPKMGFCQTWVKWVLKCISTISFAFNVNGEKMIYVKPQREISQDDPLSLYLFLLCAERFSNLLN